MLSSNYVGFIEIIGRIHVLIVQKEKVNIIQLHESLKPFLFPRLQEGVGYVHSG